MPDAKRLRLTAVTEESRDGIFLPPTKLIYNETPIAIRNSKGQDYWGFYNGKNSNQTLIPPEEEDCFLFDDTRSTVPEFTKAGIITEIQYPTGRSHVFEYEVNEYGESSTGAIVNDYEKENTSAFAFVATDEITSKVVEFSIDHDQYAEIVIDYTSPCNCDIFYNIIKVESNQEITANKGRSRRSATRSTSRRRMPSAAQSPCFEEVELPNPAAKLRMYPHELSGGMRQRVMLAIAMAARPSLLIADEPTTALDTTTQAQIVELLRRIRDVDGTSILLVSHDFGVIAEMCDDVAVMYGGFIVESGPVEEVCLRPKHPYTKALIASVPTLAVPERGYRRPTIPGPPLGTTPYASGCPFAPRWALARPECEDVSMTLVPVASAHTSACPFGGE